MFEAGGHAELANMLKILYLRASFDHAPKNILLIYIPTS